MAKSVQQALKYEPKAPVHEVFIADSQDKPTADAIGFEYQPTEEE